MDVVLSAHFDIAHPVPYLLLKDSNLQGLVDNFAGVFAVYQTAKKLNVPAYFTNYEEIDYDGAIAVAQTLKKDTFVIVVDTIKQSDIAEKKASITNVYHFDPTNLKREFNSEIHFIDGFFEETEDETFIYGKRFGFKTMYFGIPIPGDYHAVDNTCSIKTIDTYSQLLEKLILTLQKEK
jgi:hypothetical protein